MVTHCSILAWKDPWTEEPGGLQSMGSHRVGHNWAQHRQENHCSPQYNSFFWVYLKWNFLSETFLFLCLMWMPTPSLLLPPPPMHAHSLGELLEDILTQVCDTGLYSSRFPRETEAIGDMPKIQMYRSGTNRRYICIKFDASAIFILPSFPTSMSTSSWNPIQLSPVLAFICAAAMACWSRCLLSPNSSSM